MLRRRNFAPYFIGNAASACGTWFQNLAASILLYRLTHSALLLGVLTACQYAPVLLLAPVTGRVADSFDRRRLLLVTQSVAAFISGALGILVWTGHERPWLVIACSAALGTVTAVSNPTQMALVGSLVPKEDLAQAIALNSMTFNLARALGPVGATGVIAAFGIAPAFVVNAGSFLLLVAALQIVAPAPVARQRRASMRESLSVLRAEPRLAALLAVGMAASSAADPVNTESPAIAHALGRDPIWSGAIVGCFGLGAVAAAVVVGPRVAESRRVLGATLALLGSGVALVGASPSLPFGGVFLVIGGFGFLSASTGAAARLQLGVAESQRGRIMALWSVAFLGVRPLASLADGALAGAAGIRVAAPIMALPALAGAAALLWLRLSPRAEAEHAAC